MLKLNGVYATIQDAVEVLGLTESYVRRLIRQGRIEGALKVGHEWLIPVVDGQIKIERKRKQKSY